MEISKLVEESGSRASMLMVRQLSERVALDTCWMIDMAEELTREYENGLVVLK